MCASVFLLVPIHKCSWTQGLVNLAVAVEVALVAAPTAAAADWTPLGQALARRVPTLPSPLPEAHLQGVACWPARRSRLVARQVLAVE